MSTAPALAPYLRAAPRYQPPYDDEVPSAALRLVVAGTDELPFEHADLEPVLPTEVQLPLRRRLPDPAPWARQFIQAALESLSGRRPVAQLQRWTTPSVLAGIQHARRRTEPGISAPTVFVRSVHVSEPADAVAEVCAVVSRADADGPRFRAVAARLEGNTGQWRCVTLQVG